MMAASGSSGGSSSRDREEEQRRCEIDLLYFQLALPEEQILMMEPLAWRPEIPNVDPRRFLHFLRARLAEGGAGKGMMGS
jgi:hypothetical protein